MYLIVSKDKDEIKKKLDSLLQEVKAPVVTFHPESFSSVAFVQEVETVPFLSQNKAVIVFDCDLLPDDGKEAIQHYIQKPNRWVYLFLTASACPAGAKLTKLVEKQGKVLRFKEEKPWEKEKRLAGWLVEEAQKEGIHFPMQAALALVQQVDSQTLENELDKLICFAKPSGKITMQDIHALSTPAHKETLWQLGDAILLCETSRALTLGAALLDEGTAIFLLLAHLRSQFTTGLEILDASANGQIREKFPYLKGQLLEKKVHMLKKYGKSRLQKGILLLFDAELQAKNSQMDPHLLLELLIVKLESIKLKISHFDLCESPMIERSQPTPYC